MKVALTYGRFKLPTTGHIRLMSEMKQSGADEVIVASNQARFGIMASLFNDSVTFVRSNSIFKVIGEIISLYGEDVEIVFFVGQDQSKFAEQLSKSFPQVSLHLLSRTNDDPFSTKVRESYKISKGNLIKFRRECTKKHLVKDASHALTLYKMLVADPTL